MLHPWMGALCTLFVVLGAGRSARPACAEPPRSSDVALPPPVVRPMRAVTTGPVPPPDAWRPATSATSTGGALRSATPPSSAPALPAAYAYGAPLPAHSSGAVTAQVVMRMPNGNAPGSRPWRRWHAYQMFDPRPQRAARGVSGDSLAEPVPAPFGLPTLSVNDEWLAGSDGVGFLSVPALAVPSWLAGVFLQERVTLGGSTAEEDQIDVLQAGSTDVRAKGLVRETLTAGVGFTASQYLNFDLLATVKSDDDLDEIELDEAELFSQVMGEALAVRAAAYRAPFGVINTRPQANHLFLDYPLMASRILGPSGLVCDLGGEVALQPVPNLRVHAGVMSAEGNQMGPFLGSAGVDTARFGGWPRSAERDGFFGDVVAYARVQYGLGTSSRTPFYAGLSAAQGPNATGKDGATLLLGADLRLQSSTSRTTSKAWYVQTEFLWRSLDADDVFDAGMKVEDGRTLEDWGASAEAGWQLDREWTLAGRLDLVGGSGDSLQSDGAGGWMALPRNDDPYRDDRWRASIMVMWWPAAGLRVRFQYSYDDAEHLGHGEHLLWLSLEGNQGFRNNE